MICKNCEQNFEGKFCATCGQNSKVKKINFKYLVADIQESLLQVNRGFFFTLKELFTRPGHAIRDFLEGKRVRHYKPVAYLLVTSTIYILFTYLMDRNTFIEDAIIGFNEGASENNPNTDFSYLDWIADKQIYVTLLLIPLFSLSSYLAFIKSKYNFFEHLVINCYIIGQQMIFHSISVFFIYKENFFLLIPFIVSILYNYWTFTQVFNNKKSTTKIALIFSTYFIFFLILIAIFFIVGAFVNLFYSFN